MRPKSPQLRWQSAALKTLLDGADTYDRGAWMPAGEATAAIQNLANCTPQAATGALRSLLHAGLADRAETYEGVFWKPTEAAIRANTLVLERFSEEVEAINELVTSIEGKADEALWMTKARQRIDAAQKKLGADLQGEEGR